MPAHNHVNPDQLRMFVPARELREDFHPTDAGLLSETPKSNVTRTWRQKKNEASSPTWPFYDGNRPTLAEDVKERGVQRPVIIGRSRHHGRGLIHDGHHRVAAAYAANPDMEVPVLEY